MLLKLFHNRMDDWLTNHFNLHFRVTSLKNHVKIKKIYQGNCIQHLSSALSQNDAISIAGISAISLKSALSGHINSVYIM